MAKIIKKANLAPAVYEFVVDAPLVAHKCHPGQFVIIRTDEYSERIPLTIADFDRENGYITLIVQAVGNTTKHLCDTFEEGDDILDVVGPLGHPSEMGNFGTVVVVGGGIGVAPVYPIARAYHEMGNKVISIIGARDKDLVIWQDKMAAISDELILTTDNGSAGRKGFVTDPLREMLEKGEKVDLVLAIGPVIMMKNVAATTKPFGVKTTASLNAIMVDGTGMCGGCRVMVGGENKFACVDGPEFDAHEVDFANLVMRQQMYKNQESLEYSCGGHCKCVEGMRNAMPEQPADVRNKNFKEVALGYTKEMAVDEAQRCLNCPKPRCVGSCPVNIDIPQFIHEVAQENFAEAYKILKRKSTLPAVCGRVCPQENQCEGKCVLGIKGEPVAIGRLERFVADYAREHGLDNDVEAPAERKGKKVAVVGSGPSGLTCAGDLAKMGYDVTMYEALHAAGGVLMYGIPQFRLPKEIVQHEISALEKLGVKIVVDAVIGRTFTIKELMEEEGFSAVYVGTGAGLPHFMQIDGENLNGVYSANEFLTRVNLMKAYEFPNYATPVYVGKKAAIVGAGNVAMDAARTAKRLGAEQVYIVYRRSEEEMPARKEEIGHAKEEGIELRLLNNPVAILGDDKGWVNGLKCVKMELGEADASGRRSPVAIAGSEYVLDVDMVVMAIGQGPTR